MQRLVLLIALEVCFAAGLASPAVASAKPEAQSAAPQSLDQIVRDDIAALSAPDPVARALAACRLGTMRDRAEPAVPALMRLLADGTSITPVDCWSDRSSPGLEAARALASIRPDGAVETLLQAVRSDNHDLRRNASRALGLLRDPRAVDALLMLLKDDDPAVRAEAARALGRVRRRR